MKILFFGWFIQGRSGSVIAEEMENQGHQVFKVAFDWQDKHLLALHDLALKDIYNQSNFREMINRRSRVDVTYIYKEFCPDADLIYIYQTSVSINSEDCPIPVIYNHHEILLPCLPRGRLDFIFSGFHGCKEQLNKIYCDEVYQKPFVRTHFPIKISTFNGIKNSKKIFLGFKGAFKVINPDNDPAMDGIYIKRREYLTFARVKCGCYIEGFSINPNQFRQLIYFLSQCNLSLNISGCIGDWGFNNERMLLSCMCGCVLVHNWYPSIERDGFIDMENCLLFKTQIELLMKIKWAKTHPIELEEIRKNGYNTVCKLYNSEKIVKEQLNIIENYIESLSDPTIKPAERLYYKSLLNFNKYKDEWYEWFQLFKFKQSTLDKEPKLEDL